MLRTRQAFPTLPRRTLPPQRGESRKGYFHGLARREAVPARFYFSSTNGGRTFLRRLNATVSCPRIYESSVGARQWVRQDGGSGGQFYRAQPLQPTQTLAPTGERLQIFLPTDRRVLYYQSGTRLGCASSQSASPGVLESRAAVYQGDSGDAPRRPGGGRRQPPRR